MAIETRCTHCNSSFRVPATAVGKRTKCPKCQQPFTVAANLGMAPEQWYAKSPSDEQFGPIPKTELDQWVAEGRIDAQWQLLREGDAQWRWAADVCPAVSQPRQDAVPEAISIGGNSSPAFPASPIAVDGGASGKYQPPFRPRKYPAMRFVSYFFYALAALTAVSLLISLVFLAIFAGGGMLAAAGGDELSAMGGGMALFMAVFMAIASLLYHGMLIAIFLYAAESVRIVLDIQQNTQEMAHFTKYGPA